MSVKETYEVEVKARLQGLDAQIKDMAQRADQAGSDARAEYQARLASLKTMRDDLNERWKELEKSSDAAWNNLRSGFDKALTDFANSVEDARAQFKN